MRRCTLNKIASVTQRLRLDRNAILGDEIPAEAGTVIAARVLNSKTSYNKLEDLHGRMVTLHPGDVIAGALGHRDALYGYSGRVPEAVAVGDNLQLLNLGGVIGAGAEASPIVGEPFQLEVLGCINVFPHLERRIGVPASVVKAALPAIEPPSELPPITVLLGTSMDAGKTTAAAVLIAELTRRGKNVAAAKLTGVSLRRDILQMSDCGAKTTTTFTDFGVVTTDESNAVGAAHSILGHLADAEPDWIVLEMGDGILGTYGVNALLKDPLVRRSIRTSIVCAVDPVGAWGAVHLLQDRYGLRPTMVSGRVTDTPVGRRFCRENLGLPPWNALRDAPKEAADILAAQLLVAEAEA